LKSRLSEPLPEREVERIEKVEKVTVVSLGTKNCLELGVVAVTPPAKGAVVGSTGIAPGLKKRKRSEIPPDQITSGDEARYVKQEERAARRMADDDPDYENTSMRSSSSD
jgi:hypothetical protein